MKIIHPRRSWRKVINALRKVFFRINCRCHHVECYLGKNCKIQGCRVISGRSGRIVIGNDSCIKHCLFGFCEEDGQICIGDGVIINARPYAPTGLYTRGKTALSIGDDCLISDSVEISTTDWHTMLDEDGRVTNEDGDVTIGEHVWICRRVLIGKSVVIGNGCVVGANSIVTKSFPDRSMLIAGNPAVIKRNGIRWRNER